MTDKFDSLFETLSEGFGLNTKTTPNTNPTQTKERNSQVALNSLKSNPKLKPFVAPDGKVDLKKVSDALAQMPEGEEKKAIQDALGMLSGT
jgi:hypothetical protein